MLRGVVVLLVLAVAGCSDSSGASGPPAEVAVPAGVSVSVLQYRSDQAVRRVQIKVRNDGTAPVTVAGASLSAAGFAGDAAWTSRGGTDDATIGPGEAVDLPAALPARVTCPGSRPVTATARLRLRGSGSDPTSRPVAATDPYGALTTVHEQDCLEQAAARVARIELVEPLRTEGRRTFLDLRLTPTGGSGTVTVESVRSTTLLDPPDGDAWKLGTTVGTGGAVTASLELQPARCDPHAIAEDKLGTVFTLTLHVDRGASGVVDLPASTKLRGEIQNWVLAACGLH